MAVTPEFDQWSAAALGRNPWANPDTLIRKYTEQYGPVAQKKAQDVTDETGPSFIDLLGRGLAHGSLKLGEAGGVALRYIGGLSGMEGVQETGADIARYFGREAAAYTPPEDIQGSIVDKPGLLLDSSWWAYNLADVVPSLAASLVPGVGAAKAIQVGGKAVAMNPATISKLARIGGSIVGGVTGGSLEGAHTFQEVLRRGGTEQEARRAMELMTLASAGLNALSLGHALRATGSRLGMAGHMATAGVIEGLTEWLEEPAEAMILGDDVLEAMRQGLNVFPIAAVTGGLGAGVVSGTPDTTAAQMVRRLGGPEIVTTKAGLPVDKWRQLAAGLDKQIESKLNPATAQQNLTPRRARIMEGMRRDGVRLQEIQQILTGMADAAEAGTLPSVLNNITNRKQVEYIRDKIAMAERAPERAEELLRFPKDDEIYLRKMGMGTPERWQQAVDSVRQFIVGETPQQQRTRALAEAERELIGAKIPGWFPTPPQVTEKLLDLADIHEDMQVLEPSAGTGSIADSIREQHPNAKLAVIELQDRLRRVLELKDYKLADRNFLEHTGQYDRIVMNPPFEKNQDIDHVRHAYDLLTPGGKLVSVMGQHAFFANDKKSKAFRDWLETMDATVVDVESGAFNTAKSLRRTGVKTKILMLEKAPLDEIRAKDITPEVTASAEPPTPPQEPPQEPPQAPPEEPPKPPPGAPPPPTGGEQPLPKYAGEPEFHTSVNLNRIKEGPEGIRKLIDTMARERFSEFKGKSLGRVPQEVSISLARILGMTPARLRVLAQDRKWDMSQLHAAKQLAVNSAADLQQLALKAKQTGSDADKIAYEQAYAATAAILSDYAGLATAYGRALNILNQMVGPDKAVLAKLRKLEGATLEQKIDDIAALESPEQVAKYTKESFGARAWDVLLFVWINSLLSGPQTHAVNIMSNTLVSALTDLEYFVASGIGKFHAGDKVYFREAASRAFGNIQGIREALRGVNKVPADLLDKLELRSRNALSAEQLDLKGAAGKIADVTGNIIGVPGKLLQLEDNFFKAYGYRKTLNQLIVHRALSEGLQGEAKQAFIRDQMAHPDKELAERAWKEAQYLTFTNKPGHITQAILRVTREHPVLRFILPFIRTPSNIIRFFAQRTPVAPILMREVREQLAAGGRERDIAMARIMTGSAIGGLVMSLALDGLITGGGPSDPRERQYLYNLGWAPNSIKIGDTYYSYGRLEPIGMLFGVSADLADVMHLMGEGDTSEIASLITLSIAKELANKTWLRGLSEAIRAIEDPDRYGDHWVRNFLGSFLPTGIAQFARTQDPTLRHAETIVEQWKSRLPGLRQGLRPRLNIWGEPIRMSGGLGPDMVSPVYISQQKADSVSRALVDLDYYPGMPQKRIGNVELTPAQYQEYVQLSGMPAKAILQQLISSPGFQAYTTQMKRDLIQDVIRKARRQAATTIESRYPEIRRKQLEQLAAEAVGG